MPWRLCPNIWHLGDLVVDGSLQEIVGEADGKYLHHHVVEVAMKGHRGDILSAVRCGFQDPTC